MHIFLQFFQQKKPLGSQFSPIERINIYNIKKYAYRRVTIELGLQCIESMLRESFKRDKFIFLKS